jgi:hypothetical protein
VLNKFSKPLFSWKKEMKIQIDTKTDSPDEIRKVIKLLMGLVGGHNVYTNEQPQEEKPASQPNIFDSPGPAVPNLMSMFDSSPQPEAPAPEKKEDVPQVEFY